MYGSILGICELNDTSSINYDIFCAVFKVLMLCCLCNTNLAVSVI